MNDDEIFDKFIKNNTADDIKLSASMRVFYTGNPLNVLTGPGVAATHIIRELILNDSIAPTDLEALIVKLARHYHLENWKPPIPYFREALALMVQLKIMVANILPVKNGYPISSHPKFCAIIDKLIDNSNEFETANDVYALSHEKIKKLYERIYE